MRCYDSYYQYRGPMTLTVEFYQLPAKPSELQQMNHQVPNGLFQLNIQWKYARSFNGPSTGSPQQWSNWDEGAQMRLSFTIDGMTKKLYLDDQDALAAPCQNTGTPTSKLPN